MCSYQQAAEGCCVFSLKDKTAGGRESAVCSHWIGDYIKPTDRSFACLTDCQLLLLAWSCGCFVVSALSLSRVTVSTMDTVLLAQWGMHLIASGMGELIQPATTHSLTPSRTFDPANLILQQMESLSLGRSKFI